MLNARILSHSSKILMPNYLGCINVLAPVQKCRSRSFCSVTFLDEDAELSHTFFARRHIGPRPMDRNQMLKVVGCESLQSLCNLTIPNSIRYQSAMDLPTPVHEHKMLKELRAIAEENEMYKNYIGMGYYDCIVPSVVVRQMLENAGWITQYTPYQAEIAQGRLESLMNFQTMIADLTGLEVSNASLLDEATACAEAMTLAYRVKRRTKFLVDATMHPQNIAVVKTRAEPLNFEVVVCKPKDMRPDKNTGAIILQYPDTFGTLGEFDELISRTKENGGSADRMLHLCPSGTTPGTLWLDKCLAELLDFQNLEASGCKILNNGEFFDTIHFKPVDTRRVELRARQARVNLRYFDDGTVGISLDETTEAPELHTLLQVCCEPAIDITPKQLAKEIEGYRSPLIEKTSVHSRKTPYMQHPVFNSYHSEPAIVRYMKKLENKDLSLVHSMIPLGSCTMKLNSSTELIPLSWNHFSAIHPFAPEEQTFGYRLLLSQLEMWLCEITGYDHISFQPNSGAQGEYAGLLAIRNYLAASGEGHRNVCLIPDSAHGTNPASASMAGMDIVTVRSDKNGAIDLHHLDSQIKKHENNIAAIMVTYPSTFGVFDEHITAVCDRVHSAGGQFALLNANYLMKRLESAYKIEYSNKEGLVAHEFIIDCKQFKKSAGVTVVDIAKRLMDYGFHAPTVSWPVADCLMVEPTESEDKKMLDRFAEAMLCIREEIAQIERGEVDKVDNVLKPSAWTDKLWPAVGRIDDAAGDTNLVCTCPPVSDYA